MSRLTQVNGDRFTYSHIVGTGGIGSGMLFKLTDNRTVGRNESRPGVLVPAADYCKLHIILHYAAVLLGADTAGDLKIFPIGKVGDDEIGNRLVREMEGVGIDVRNIATEKCSVTLFSVCFQYPDGAGGNITTSNSACNKVSPADIELFFNDFTEGGQNELILSVPEVPSSARIRLLELGRNRGSFTVASLLASETEEFERKGIYALIDLLSVNMEEARAIAGLSDNAAESGKVVEKCIDKLIGFNPRIMLTVTDGVRGNYGYTDNRLEQTAVFKAEVESTAGAGDAFLGGAIAGLACGLPFLKGANDSYFAQTALGSAVELGTLLAGLSVTSPDTIHKTADAGMLFESGRRCGAGFSDFFLRCFRNVEDNIKFQEEMR